ncbi:hypothetical protein DPEC_G00138420 [Dallia pectoralis]|uniref:Uncharacterized protein n=1 Tax=Dallia pectoralis TaxID=75939 RepID=A0ACC2GMF2_DALPE|nr:hypothetical protein DPEC_G00138420 [Dallia pectoralis]
MVQCFALPLLTILALASLLPGELVFYCSSCTAERQAACPKLVATCTELVREPGCGCCPVCARLEGEFCGVYTPRCSTGLRCYPAADAHLPLQQLLQGLGRCSRNVDWDVSVEAQDTQVVQINPPRIGSPGMWYREMALRHAQNELKTRMKINTPDEEPSSPPPTQGPCQQELDRVLKGIFEMTFNDNRGPVENLYELKLPNCDRTGQYNPKQCHMSSHGQRGECWCVNPFTGVQISQSNKVRGDPQCSQYEEQRTETGELATGLLQMAEI